MSRQRGRPRPTTAEPSPLRRTLDALLQAAGEGRMADAQTTLPGGLEVKARLNPPRLILSRAAPAAFGPEVAGAEREGVVCAGQMDWEPWLAWDHSAGRPYLIVSDRRLWHGLIDHACKRLGPDSEEAVFLRYDAGQEVLPPRAAWNRYADPAWDSFTHARLRFILQV